MLGLFLFLPLLSSHYVCGLPPSPIVDLGYSRYRGIRLPAGIDEYLGMRYAAPPLGDLRFRSPRDPVSTPGVQDVAKASSISADQVPNQNITAKFAEDCLFINVFTPSNATADSKLPVWVHIQGGGYARNDNGNFNGTKIIQESGLDFIFVNFNYRVGAFGFLASEYIRDDGDLNVGLLDQRKALEWVQKHIAKFGGNPDHVVIHGDSAGAGSIAHHMTAYGGRDDHLFVGAIYESPFWPTLRTVAEMEFQFDRVVQDTGCADSESSLSCLRKVDFAKLQAANAASPFPGADRKPLPLWYFLPVIDDDLIEDKLYTLFEQGRMLRVPLLVGDDTNEGSTFAANASTTAEMSSFLKANYPNLRPQSLEKIHGEYPLMAHLSNHSAYFPSTSAAYGDATFTCPGDHITGSLAGQSLLQIWNYRYNVRAASLISKGLGVPHIFEISAIFGVGNAGESSVTSYTDVNKDIVPIVMDYWISFIKHLDPNPARNSKGPFWEPWGLGTEKRLKMQTNETGMELVPLNLTDHCLMWKSLVAEM
ncbi:hypothetical protein FE257_012250 [Aspergillus nanangensis]|uniref:Carboxylic ester hydrolase n=1 Tax=Aspergillus nanangensis TaxID=2582783 RepID=A0AAD4CHQ8_ASPNN|nr:hypothetical protein FE257_012250 [Aspergillus nanangensis]